ncbi:MAG: ABC transporter ATP-binding protein [Flavobacteriales bacterium]|nr:ABC transporter ATP-binding protein [Flavobacteriales bacterium]
MIILNKVYKSFNSYKALQNLSLEVASGEIYGLLGANGAGKSTTLNLILGFLKPDQGVISISNSQKINLDEVGYIPENVNLYSYLTGLENLDYFCKLSGFKYDRNKLSKFLDDCGLQRIAHDKKISSYSKGMRQKVGIAIAYAKKAKVYLLDEPASGLDPLSSNELSEILKQLSANGASILMASHDLFRVRESCHKIGILKNGTLLKEMKSSEVSPQELESIYIKFMKN